MSLGDRPDDKSIRKILKEIDFKAHWDGNIPIQGGNGEAKEFYCRQLDRVAEILEKTYDTSHQGVAADVVKDMWYHAIGEFEPLLKFINEHLKQGIGKELTDQDRELGIWAFVTISFVWWEREAS